MPLSKRELTDTGSNWTVALDSTERQWSQLWVRGKWRICGKILRLRYLSGKEMEREKTSEIGIFEKWKRKQKNRKVWVYGKNVDGYNSLDWKNEGQTKMCRVARKSHVQAQNCRNLLMCVRRQPRWPRLRPVVVRWLERIVNNGVREKKRPFLVQLTNTNIVAVLGSNKRWNKVVQNARIQTGAILTIFHIIPNFCRSYFELYCLPAAIETKPLD